MAERRPSLSDTDPPSYTPSYIIILNHRPANWPRSLRPPQRPCPLLAGLARPRPRSTGLAGVAVAGGDGSTAHLGAHSPVHSSGVTFFITYIHTPGTRACIDPARPFDQLVSLGGGRNG